MSNQLQTLHKRLRASSVQEPQEQKAKLPNILTPTFADWKLIGDSKAHPKISRRNPLFKFGLIPTKKATTPSSSVHDNPHDFRGLKSEEQSQRVKRHLFEDRVSTTETNNIQQLESEKKQFQLRSRSISGQKQSNQLLVECKQLFDEQKRVFEEILKHNNLYSKYQKVIEKEQSITQQKILQIFNLYK